MAHILTPTITAKFSPKPLGTNGVGFDVTRRCWSSVTHSYDGRNKTAGSKRASCIVGSYVVPVLGGRVLRSEIFDCGAALLQFGDEPVGLAAAT